MKHYSILWLSLALIAAISLAGCGGSPGASPSVVAPDTSPPQAPSALHDDHDSTTHADTLAWNASPSPDVVSYQVYQYAPDPANATSYAWVANTSAAQPWYLIPSLPEGGTVYFRVRAVDAAGNASAFSAEIAITLDAVPIYIKKPGKRAGVPPNDR